MAGILPVDNTNRAFRSDSELGTTSDHTRRADQRHNDDPQRDDAAEPTVTLDARNRKKHHLSEKEKNTTHNIHGFTMAAATQGNKLLPSIISKLERVSLTIVFI